MNSFLMYNLHKISKIFKKYEYCFWLLKSKHLYFLQIMKILASKRFLRVDFHFSAIESLLNIIIIKCVANIKIDSIK